LALASPIDGGGSVYMSWMKKAAGSVLELATELIELPPSFLPRVCMSAETAKLAASPITLFCRPKEQCLPDEERPAYRLSRKLV
jgi:hypothetical protein